MTFLSVKQAAARLGLSAKTIRTMIWDREIADVRISKRAWLIPESELKRLAERAQNGNDVKGDSPRA